MKPGTGAFGKIGEIIFEPLAVVGLQFVDPQELIGGCFVNINSGGLSNADAVLVVVHQ
ncbi:MAG TPA: hypothetical protein PLS07_00645 [Niabella sp.]|nr:hypothetical protein [Niabella sp.]HRC19221.1 hypothetical protein [Niabella sp.]